MPTYIIGDVQGCYVSLMNLLELAQVNESDQVWLVGDLVNRGPRSLDVLRWAMKRSDQVQVVLGNHDLHLLACVYGAKQGRGDTLTEVLESPDRDQLIEWLRAQPILFEAQVSGRHVAMVHAGVNPQWSWAETRRRARAIESALQSEVGLSTLSSAHPTRKDRAKRQATQESALNPVSSPHSLLGARELEWVRDLEWFTRVRALDADLKPARRFKGGLVDLPPELTPWFQFYQEAREVEHAPDHLYFGHWAALGLHTTSRYTALDSGCIWGRYLSAIRVEDGAIFQTPTAERALTPKHQRVSSAMKQ